jgi:hypothetical protein
MNNVWTVALKTPCTGLRLSFSPLRRTLAPIVAIGTARCFISSKSTSPWNTATTSRTPEFAQLYPLSQDTSRVSRRPAIETTSPTLRPGGRPQIGPISFKCSRRSFFTTTNRSASKKPKAKLKSRPKAKTDSPSAPTRTEVPRTSRKPESEVDASHTASPEAAQVQLSAQQVESILGPGLTFDKGMQVLQDLQYRRVTGSLAEQGISFPDDAEIKSEHAERGLNWLRENYPVDEETAAAEWADEEAARLDAKYTQRAEELWLYKKNDDEPEVLEIQQHDKGGLYGQSVLEKRREEVKARKEAEEAEAEKALEAGDAPPQPYKGYSLIVKQKAELGKFSTDSVLFITYTLLST